VSRRARASVFSAVAASLAAVLTGSVLMVCRRQRRITGADRPWHNRPLPLSSTSRRARNLQIAALSARLGGATALTRARATFASAERREELNAALQLRSATEVAQTLGQMKGALMKIGQMASYIDEGLPEPVRDALAQLQADAPPMTPELAASVVADELGAPPEAVFLEWDPQPIASASIGQVHRAITRDGRAVAVKVQYPGVADAISSDLANADLIFSSLALVFPGFEPAPVVAELKERISEELDYRREAANQQLFADFYAGHPFIHVPAVVPELSTARVLTGELATGATFAEMEQWSQAEKDRVGEILYRFVFRSLYRLGAFNGDPHPGNYLFTPGGQVTFLDFGLIRRFGPDELATFRSMITAMVIDRDPEAFRRAVVSAGLLAPDAPVTTADVAEFFSQFYKLVSQPGRVTCSAEYASALVRQTFNRQSPVTRYTTVPASFVLIQRINLGLFALLGRLAATADWRRITEEIWPWVDAPPATPLGRLEAEWWASRRDRPAPELRLE
jgi:predicted unusual protein kinase regulating ubiquinone biosynthesis (AarF/ABC1/UbiB family)